MTLQIVQKSIELQKVSCYAVENDECRDERLYSTIYGRRMEFDEDQAVSAWLSEKFDISQSDATLKNYKSIMGRFRAFLVERGLHLDPWHNLPESTSDQQRRQALGSFALAIREFSERDAQGNTSMASTYEMRLKALSSFYQFCNKYDLLFCGNPVDRIKRPRIKPYQHSRALDIGDVVASMAAIDRTTKKGCRDYALLSVLLETGRRVSEVLHVQWRDLTRRADGSLEVYFSRTKGGGTKRDLLSKETSDAVLAWIRLAYEGHTPRKTAWIWTSLSARSADEHPPLRYEAARQVMTVRLGTSSVHRARHTWVTAMRRLGADLEEIQDGLGHSSIAVTKLYDRQVREVKNPRRENLAKLYGFNASASEAGETG